MRTNKTALITVVTFIIVACHTSKKSTVSTASTAPAPAVASTTTTSSTSAPVLIARPGLYAPGDEELAAIQVKYKDVTIEKLKEGHLIYTQGACINCHKAKDIHRFEEHRWPDIIDNMARAAKISEAQKDAVYKYVLAIKATQPKQAR
jgi:hypothetical protein